MGANAEVDTTVRPAVAAPPPVVTSTASVLTTAATVAAASTAAAAAVASAAAALPPAISAAVGSPMVVQAVASPVAHAVGQPKKRPKIVDPSSITPAVVAAASTQPVAPPIPIGGEPAPMIGGSVVAPVPVAMPDQSGIEPTLVASA